MIKKKHILHNYLTKVKIITILHILNIDNINQRKKFFF